MDLITIIRKYVSLSIKRDDLSKIISICDKNIEYSVNGGNRSYSEGDLALKKSYYDSVNDSKYRKLNASYELTRVNVLLQEVHGLFMNAISGLSASDLEKYRLLCLAEVTKLESMISELEIKRKFAIEKGDEAFKINSFYQEEFYNNICNECFDKMEELRPELYYFKSFEADLEVRVNLKNSNDVLIK